MPSLVGLTRSQSEGNIVRVLSNARDHGSDPASPRVSHNMIVRVRLNRSEKVIGIEVNPFANIQCLKRMVNEHRYGSPEDDSEFLDVEWHLAGAGLRRTLSSAVASQHLPRLFVGGCELNNRTLCADLPTSPKLEEESDILHAVWVNRHGETSSIQIVGGTTCHPTLQAAMVAAEAGLAAGLRPILAEEGLGGTYFLREPSAQHRIVAVFKPADQEPYAPNNPRGYQGQLGTPGVRPGYVSGEANAREVAAYILDWRGGASVPPTARVEICNDFFGQGPKVGSLQLFCEHDDVVGDLSSSNFTVEQAQRVALLDIRLLNADRNEGNLLARKNAKKEQPWRRRGTLSEPGTPSSPEVAAGSPVDNWLANFMDSSDDDEEESPPSGPSEDEKYQLIPIDHGYILTTLNITWWDWTWLTWKQLKQPVVPSLAEWIQSVDSELEEATLKARLGRVLPKKALLMLHITTRLLKLTVAAGLTVREIAEMVAREEPEEPSILESIVAHAAAVTASDPRANGNTTSQTEPTPGATVQLHRSWSDNAVNLRANMKPDTALAALPVKKSKSSDFVDKNQDEEHGMNAAPQAQEKDMMDILSQRAETIPDVFWLHFDAAVQRAITKCR